MSVVSETSNRRFRNAIDMGLFFLQLNLSFAFSFSPLSFSRLHANCENYFQRNQYRVALECETK